MGTTNTITGPNALSLDFEFPGIGTISAERLVNKAKTRYWYNAFTPLVALPGDDPMTALAALPTISVAKVELKAGVPHISQPGKNGRGGGNPTVTHSGSIEVEGHKFTVMVTVTFVDKGEKGKGYRISAKAMNQVAREAKTVGSFAGFVAV